MATLIRPVLIWAALAAAVSVPLAVAAASPLLAFREAVYVAAGFAGALAMALLLVQPMLAGGWLPGLAGPRGRRAHGWVGAGLVAALVVHVAGLWITSPPDVVDALLFRSPTPFAVWGVAAMWAAFAAALMAALRRRLRLAPALWRLGHMACVTVAALGGVAHAMLIDGTMGPLSKAALCALVLAAWAKIMADLRPWRALARRRA
jgi:hypothetical protein